MSALVDSVCSVTLISEHLVRGRRKGKSDVRLETMNRSLVEAQAVVRFDSVMFEDEYELGPLNAYVTSTLPSGVEMVLGLDVILKHGMSISVEGGVTFHSHKAFVCKETEDKEGEEKVVIKDNDSCRVS